MKKKTLYVTDLDGTLLGGDSRISNASAEMLTRLADAGVMFTAATARTPATVQPLMRNVGQSVYIDSDGVSQPLPVIVMTGAGMWNRAACRFDSCELIPEEDALRIRLSLIHI